MKKIYILCITLSSFLNSYAMDDIEVIDIQDTSLSSLIRLIAENNDLNIVPSIKARNTKYSQDCFVPCPLKTTRLSERSK